MTCKLSSALNRQTVMEIGLVKVAGIGKTIVLKMQDWWPPSTSRRNFIANHSSTAKVSPAAQTSASQVTAADSKTRAAPRAVQFASIPSTNTSSKTSSLNSWPAENKFDSTSSTNFIPSFHNISATPSFMAPSQRLRAPRSGRSRTNHPSSPSGGPGPEELAAAMHRHQAGLKMSSAPTTMIQFLFPYQAKGNCPTLSQDCEPIGPGSWAPWAPLVDNALFTVTKMRGTSNPPGFPGFLVCLPATDGKIVVAPTPSPVLSKAHADLHAAPSSVIFIS